MLPLLSDKIEETGKEELTDILTACIRSRMAKFCSDCQTEKQSTVIYAMLAYMIVEMKNAPEHENFEDSPTEQVAALRDDEECGGNTVHSHNVAIPAQEEDVNHSLQIIGK